MYLVCSTFSVYSIFSIRLLAHRGGGKAWSPVEATVSPRNSRLCELRIDYLIEDG